MKGFSPPPDRNLYPAELPEAVGTRTSKGTSHPMTCGGCYHAQVMAGGESQLSVFIANQVLLDFSEDGIVRSSCYEILFRYRSLGVPFGLATAESLWNLPESSLSAEVIRL